MSAKRAELNDNQPSKPSWWLDELCRASQISQRFDRQIDGWLSGFDLPQPAIRILIALYQSPGTPQRIIGDQIQMSPPQISRNIKDLVEQGLVDVDRSFPERLRVLRLTYAGQLQARELITARKAAFAAAIDAVAVEDRPLVFSMSRFQRVPGSEGQRPTMSPLGPVDAVFLFNWILAALPTTLVNQPHFLAFASGTLSDALRRWPVFNDSAGVVLRDTDGNIVGACAIIADQAAGSATLVGPFVEPNYRRRGLGTQMLSECQSICTRQAITKLVTNIPACLSNISGFLRTKGFVTYDNSNEPDHFGGRAWEGLKSNF